MKTKTGKIKPDGSRSAIPLLQGRRYREPSGVSALLASAQWCCHSKEPGPSSTLASAKGNSTVVRKQTNIHIDRQTHTHTRNMKIHVSTVQAPQINRQKYGVAIQESRQVLYSKGLTSSDLQRTPVSIRDFKHVASRLLLAHWLWMTLRRTLGKKGGGGGMYSTSTNRGGSMQWFSDCIHGTVSMHMILTGMIWPTTPIGSWRV